ncbi:DNA-packaging protein [Primorskyibacter sp. 2E107]|uniref:DNA-packaging protein n=1 Tax=Primorskyibacter sp. 2E107 TaxID=3403458 RepID=UPI003AF96D28
MRSGAAWIASAPVAVQTRFLDSLDRGERLALPFLFDFWAHPHQLPPEGDWRTWVILGGRGAGKTRAGAEWVRSMVEGPRPMDTGRCKRVALVGETLDQVREVMIFGDSGILSCSPPDRMPKWVSGRQCLVWPNGAEAMAFSAFNPESLRGPQFDGAWADELGKWPKGRETWDQLQFALRLGEAPRACVTTTPRNVEVLKSLLELPSTVRTHAPTEANRAHLASSFLAEVRARYAGTQMGMQELDGILVDQVDGALWSIEMLDAARAGRMPEMSRVVVAVDPPAGDGKASDACGIVVAGVVMDGALGTWRSYVLEDASVQGLGPTGWATAVCEAAQRWKADRVVAEVNQGGAMVSTVLHTVDPMLPVRSVHATRGKIARAEPVAALYEQGRVSHARGLEQLEAQMCRMTNGGYQGQGSPDRVDALVWAITELMLNQQGQAEPKVRVL